jgi:hypothetical protein
MAAENLPVAAAFGLSYQDLDGGQQRQFRRLGLHPGPDVDSCAAAALDDTSPGQARPAPLPAAASATGPCGCTAIWATGPGRQPPST